MFSNFGLTVRPGRVYGLLGKNGEGKSTLLYLMMGLLRPSMGDVVVDGERSACRRSELLGSCFLVPEEFSLPSIPLRDYVKINAPFYKSFSMDDLSRNLQNFGLDTDVHLGSLSMGEKKKVYMCFALATNTRYLLMDEPTNGLDIPSKAQFRKVVMGGMSEEKTVIISTHQVRDVDSLLDHVLMLDNGRVAIDRSVADISERLCFKDLSFAESARHDVLYAQPSAGGNNVVMPRRGGEDETVINLEVLFNAMLVNPEGVREALGSESVR